MSLFGPRLNKTVVFVGIFALSLLLRVVFVFQWDQTPYGGEPLLDAMVYDNWAQDIAQGHLLRHTAFYASPFYPYLLGGLYAIFGHDLLIPGLFNALIGAATAVALTALTCSLFGLEAALGAGVLAAFDMPLIFYTAPVMKEPLALLLLTLFMIFVFRVMESNRQRDYIWTGVLMGLLALVRGNALVLAPVLLAMACWKWRRESVRNAIAFVLAMCLCIAPATLHNFIAAHDFVPINYAYGFNLYIGNSPNANGTNNYPAEVSADPIQEEHATSWAARQALGHAPKPSEVSDYWRDRALTFMWNNPWREPELIWNKSRAFWNMLEAFDNYDIDFVRKNFDTLLSGHLTEFWLVVALAAFGAVAAWREKRENVAILGIFTFAYMASVLIFYVTDRYRLPVLVFLLPLSGAAVPCGWKLWRASDWEPFAAASALALAALAISLAPFPNLQDLNAFDWGTLTVVYADEHQDGKALDAFRKGINISPNMVGSQTYESAASIEHKLGNDAAAESFYQLGLQSYPTNGIFLYNYGRFRALKGDMPGALAAMQRASQFAPSYTLIYYGIARIYERLGERAKALETARKGLAVNPDDGDLRKLLSRLE